MSIAKMAFAVIAAASFALLLAALFFPMRKPKPPIRPTVPPARNEH